MTPKEALNILAQATGDYKGTRKDHEMIVEAIQILQPLVEEPKEEVKE